MDELDVDFKKWWANLLVRAKKKAGDAEAANKVQNAATRSELKRGKAAPKSEVHHRFPVVKGILWPQKLYLKKLTRMQKDDDDAVACSSGGTSQEDGRRNTFPASQLGTVASDSTQRTLTVSAPSGCSQTTLSFHSAAKLETCSSPILKTPLLSGSKARVAELVVERMQQFKRVAPEQLKHSLDDSLPKAVAGGSFPDESEEQNPPENGTPDLPSTEHDGALALALQQEIKEEVPESLEEEGLFFCQICQKDLSAMNTTRRGQHVNRCLDEIEEAEISSSSKPTIPECPICGMQFQTPQNRATHLKRCAVKMAVSPKRLLQAVQLQMSTHGGAPLQYPSNQPSRSKRKGSSKEDSKQKRAKMKTKDEDLQVAMAMSRSLLEQEKREQAASVTDVKPVAALPIKWKPGSEKKGRKRGPTAPPPLLLQDPETARKRIEERVATVLVEDVEFPPTPQLPTSSILEDGSGKAAWLMPLPKNKDSSLWNSSALTGPRDPELFYTAGLNPPVVPVQSSKSEIVLPSVGSDQPEVSQEVDSDLSSRDPASVEVGGQTSDESKSGPEEDGQVSFESQDVQTPQDLVELAREGLTLTQGNLDVNHVQEAEQSREETTSGDTPLSGFVPPSKEKRILRSSSERFSLGLLSADFGAMVNNPHLSDVQFQVDSGEVLYAHTFVLYARCPRAVQIVHNEGFLVEEDGNAQTRRVLLSDVTEEAACAFLQYLYTADADIPARMLPQVGALAARFGVGELMAKCENSTGESQVSSGVDSEDLSEQEEKMQSINRCKNVNAAQVLSSPLIRTRDVAVQGKIEADVIVISSDDEMELEQEKKSSESGCPLKEMEIPRQLKCADVIVISSDDEMELEQEKKSSESGCPLKEMEIPRQPKCADVIVISSDDETELEQGPEIPKPEHNSSSVTETKQRSSQVSCGITDAVHAADNRVTEIKDSEEERSLVSVSSGSLGDEPPIPVDDGWHAEYLSPVRGDSWNTSRVSHASASTASSPRSDFWPDRWESPVQAEGIKDSTPLRGSPRDRTTTLLHLDECASTGLFSEGSSLSGRNSKFWDDLDKEEEEEELPVMLHLIQNVSAAAGACQTEPVKTPGPACQERDKPPETPMTPMPACSTMETPELKEELSSNQPSRSKRKGSSKEDSKQKRAKMKTKDEDLQVAMAMSRSLLEQEKREQAASVTNVKPVAALPIKWKPGSGEETTSGDTPLSGFVPPSKEKRILRSSSERFSLGLLSADFSAMVNNPHLSDVQFQVDSGEVLYAHTFVLYARCPRAVQIVHNEGFLVEEDGNAQTRRVLLSDVTEEAACAFLQYLYTADADIPARMLPQVGALAARFGVGELMAKCENSTGESQVSSGVDSEDLSEQEEKMQSINRCKNVNAAQVLSSPLIRTRDVAVQGKIEADVIVISSDDEMELEQEKKSSESGCPLKEMEIPRQLKCADVIVISSDDEMELEQEKKSSESGCPLKEMEIPRQPKCADVIVISSDDETELEQGPEIPKPEHNSSSVTETKQRSSQVSCGITDAVHAADNRVTEIKDSEEERSLVSVSSGSLGDEPPIPVDDGWHAEYLSPVRGDSWNTSRVSHASASTASSPRSDFWPDRWESPVQAEGIKDSTPLRGSPRDRTTTLLHLDECASTGLFSEGSSLSGRNSKFWDDLDKEEEEEELPVMLHLIQNVSAAAGACQTEPVKTPGPACQERDKPPETPMTPMPACSTMETPELKEELSSNQPSRSKRKGSSKEDSKQKRAKMKTKDEDLQVAMAMSRSLLEQEKREQAASVTNVKPVAALPIKWKPGSGEETTSGDTPLSGFVPPSKEKRILRSSSERFSLGLLSADFGAMVNNPHLSDVQFQVDSGEVLYAHTFVLYARCPRAVQIVHNEGFLVEEDGNAQTRRVLLSDVTEEAACAFLQYLYTADADIPARMLPQVGALAARFGVGELMAKCENSTGESQVSSGVDSEDLSEQEEKMQSINRCKNVNAAQVLSSPLIRTRDVAVQGKIEADVIVISSDDEMELEQEKKSSESGCPLKEMEIPRQLKCADVIVISSDDEMELEQEKKSSESGCPLKEMEIPRQPKCADVIVISSDDETELEQGPEIPKPEHNSSSVTETKQRSSQVSCGITDAVHAADNRVTEIKDSEEERSLVSVSSGSLGDEPPIPVDDGWHAEYLSPVRGDSWNTSRVSHASASTASSPRSDFWPDRWESPVQAEGIKDSTPLRGSPRDRTTTLLHLDECASTGLFSEGSSLSGRNSKFWDDLDKEEEEEELPVMLHLIQNVSAAAGACQTEPVKTPGPACQERDKPPETPMTPMPACSTMETPELKEELSSNQPSRSKRKGSSKEDSKQKRAKMKTKDEDLQVAMAMSRSLLEQEKREQAASVTDVKPVAALPIKWKPGSGEETTSGDTPLSGFVPPSKEKRILRSSSERFSLGLLSADFGAMVNNPHLSDVQFQVDSGEVLYAHTFVLYARCPRAVQIVHNEGFLVEEDGNAQTRRVLLSDVTEEAACAFLQYLYTADADIPARMLPQVGALAARFGVGELMAKCENSTGESQVSSGVDSEDLSEQEEKMQSINRCKNVNAAQVLSSPLIRTRDVAVQGKIEADVIVISSDDEMELEQEKKSSESGCPLKEMEIPRQLKCADVIVISSDDEMELEQEKKSSESGCPLKEMEIPRQPKCADVIVISSDDETELEQGPEIPKPEHNSSSVTETKQRSSQVSCGITDAVHAADNRVTEIKDSEEERSLVSVSSGSLGDEPPIPVDDGWHAEYLSPVRGDSWNTSRVSHASASTASSPRSDFWPDRWESPVQAQGIKDSTPLRGSPRDRTTTLLHLDECASTGLFSEGSSLSGRNSKFWDDLDKEEEEEELPVMLHLIQNVSAAAGACQTEPVKTPGPACQERDKPPETPMTPMPACSTMETPELKEELSSNQPSRSKRKGSSKEDSKQKRAKMKTKDEDLQVAGGSFPDESEEQNPPENGTPDLPSTEHDGALALALQQEIKEEVPESLEEEGLFFCQICQKDLSAMNTTRRGQHVNRCLDEIEEAEISSSSKPTIPECPICGMQFQTPQNRATHLKRCAVKMAVSPKRLPQAVQLQMSTHGGAPLQYPSNQPSRSKRKGSSKEDSKQKRAKMKTKDEDLQVAMAMSRSLLEQEKWEQAASVTNVKPVAALPIKWKPGSGEETTSGDTPLSGFVPPSKEKRILRSSSERFSLGLLSADFSAMVNNPHLSDVQFQVDSGEVLYAHMCVLYARCPRAVQIVHNEGFLVEEDGNAQTRRVLLSDVTEEAACAFLQYLYTADADIPARMLPQVGALAARFGVGELMAKCENSTGESQVSSGVDSEDLSEQEEKMQSINRCKNVNAAQVLSSPLIRTRDVAVQGKIEADVIVISSDDEMELEQEKKSSESGCPLKEMEIPRQLKCADVIVISSDDEMELEQEKKSSESGCPLKEMEIPRQLKCPDVIVISSDDETELEQGPEIPKPEHNSSSVTETKQRSSQVSCGVTDAVHAADNSVTEIKDSEKERSLVSVSSGSLGDEPPIPVDDGWHAEYLSPVRGDSWNTSRVSHASASTASSPRSDFWPDQWESPVQAQGIKDSTPLRGSPRDRTTTLLHLDECASTGLFSEGSSLSGRNSKFWDDLDKEEEEEELPVMLHLIQNVSAAAGACQTEPVKTPGPACQERDKPPETPMTPMPACSTMETPELKEELSRSKVPPFPKDQMLLKLKKALRKMRLSMEAALKNEIPSSHPPLQKSPAKRSRQLDADLEDEIPSSRPHLQKSPAKRSRQLKTDETAGRKRAKVSNAVRKKKQAVATSSVLAVGSAGDHLVGRPERGYAGAKARIETTYQSRQAREQKRSTVSPERGSLAADDEELMLSASQESSASSLDGSDISFELQSSFANEFEACGVVSEEEEEEELPPSQAAAQEADKLEAVRNYIRSNPDLYHKILFYEPLDLAVLHSELKQKGIKISKANLQDFLDAQCITFTTAAARKEKEQKGKGNKKQMRRY
ncbi:uncharacterized protein LOC112987702 [Dromaius novaehollandiae]|uniref:uncharacterized protein LOC112987702 n=1 Tax=Dromaius novaehollandiae TaxID=8790 RepID=UPI00311D321E